LMLSATDFISVLSSQHEQRGAAKAGSDGGSRQSPNTSQMLVLDIRCQPVLVQAAAWLMVMVFVFRSVSEIELSGAGMLPTSIQIEPGASSPAS
jgi:hypothetical protein